MGAGAAARARARVAEARRHRSRAPDVRLRRRAGAGGGRRLAAHPRRLRAAVRSRSPSTASRTTPEWSDDIFLDLAEADTGRSKLVGKGFFTGIYGATSVPGIKLHAEFAQAGDALTAVVAGGGLKIEGLTISGDDAGIKADLNDTFAALKVKAAFRGLDAKFDTYRALGIGFDLGFDAGAGKVDVNDFAFGAPGGGKMRLGAKLDINTMALDANLAFTDFHTESYVPPELRAMAGGKLHGPHRRARRSRAQVRAPAARRPEVLAAARKRAAARRCASAATRRSPRIASRPTG